MSGPRRLGAIAMRPLLGVLLAAATATAAVVPNWGVLTKWPPPCASDTDCYAHGALCSAFVGDGAAPVCQCPWDTAWNWTWARCEPVAGEAVQTYTYAEPPRYREYESSLEGRGQPFLPLTWHCDTGDLPTCWARDEHVEYRTTLVGDITDTASLVVHASRVQWRCRDDSRRALILSADGSLGRLVQRPIPEYCVAAAVWCYARGTRVVRDDGSCECHPTHYGPRCDEPSQAMLQLAPHDEDGLPGASGVWSSRPCDSDAACDTHELCYWRFPSGDRRCMCAAGHLPDRVHTSGCLPEQGYRYLGLIDRRDPQVSYDATFSASDSRLLYLTGTHSAQVVYAHLPVRWDQDDYRVAAADVVYFRCLEGTPRADVVDPANADELCAPPPPGEACLNGAAWNASAGACACVGGFSGARCAVCPVGSSGHGCSLGVTEGRVARCSGHGLPDSEDACHCDDARYGERCEMDASSCRVSRCHARGQCHVGDGGCTCASGYYGWYCGTSAAACDVDRCSGHGACLEQVTGCACEPPWTGAACDTPDCGAHGTWNNVTGRCACATAYTGVACELSRCGLHGYWSAGACTCLGRAEADTATGNCTRHGCGPHGRLDPRLATGVCRCSTGYHADTGATGREDVCVLTCHHEGSLLDAPPRDSQGQCTCRSGYRGPACAEFFLGSHGRSLAPATVAVLVVSGALWLFLALWSVAREYYDLRRRAVRNKW
jgi:hypothetical protein